MQKISEVFVLLDDVPGSFGNVTRILKKKGISIQAVGLFIDTARLHVDDPASALAAIQENGYQAELREVLRIELPNKPGALMGLTQKLGNAGINIINLYGALADKQTRGIIIMEVDNTRLALDIFRNDPI